MTKTLPDDIISLIAMARQRNELLEVLGDKFDIDHSYVGNEIRIPCESHGAAIGWVSKVRRAIARAKGGAS